jgi:D-3-phosphoglycerate dehydrogenase / 2-oxoglutarate reductase
MDSMRLELMTEAGTFAVEGAIVLGRPRLLQVEGIACEATLDGNLLYSKNQDVPGVIGFVGRVLGENEINIANFALGRQDNSVDGQPLMAISIIETDQPVSDEVIKQLFENKAVKFVRRVVFGS